MKNKLLLIGLAALFLLCGCSSSDTSKKSELNSDDIQMQSAMPANAKSQDRAYNSEITDTTEQNDEMSSSIPEKFSIYVKDGAKFDHIQNKELTINGVTYKLSKHSLRYPQFTSTDESVLDVNNTIYERANSIAIIANNSADNGMYHQSSYEIKSYNDRVIFVIYYNTTIDELGEFTDISTYAYDIKNDRIINYKEFTDILDFKNAPIDAYIASVLKSDANQSSEPLYDPYWDVIFEEIPFYWDDDKLCSFRFYENTEPVSFIIEDIPMPNPEITTAFKTLAQDPSKDGLLVFIGDMRNVSDFNANIDKLYNMNLPDLEDLQYYKVYEDTELYDENLVYMLIAIPKYSNSALSITSRYQNYDGTIEEYKDYSGSNVSVIFTSVPDVKITDQEINIHHGANTISSPVHFDPDHREIIANENFDKVFLP